MHCHICRTPWNYSFIQTLRFRLNPYIAVSCMGVAYSLLASALWPIAALIIPEYQLGTAYGLMQVRNPIINNDLGSILSFNGFFP